MARLWSCGFEMGSLTIEAGVLHAGSEAVIEGTTKHSGDYSMRCNGLTSGA